jgi:hypothetical protein
MRARRFIPSWWWRWYVPLIRYFLHKRQNATSPKTVMFPTSGSPFGTIIYLLCVLIFGSSDMWKRAQSGVLYWRAELQFRGRQTEARLRWGIYSRQWVTLRYPSSFKLWRTKVKLSVREYHIKKFGIFDPTKALAVSRRISTVGRRYLATQCMSRLRTELV